MADYSDLGFKPKENPHADLGFSPSAKPIPGTEKTGLPGAPKGPTSHVRPVSLTATSSDLGKALNPHLAKDPGPVRGFVNDWLEAPIQKAVDSPIRAAGGDYAGATSDAIRGIGVAALPIAGPGIMAAPGRAAIAALIGTVAGGGAEMGAKALGASDGVSELAGTVAGAIGGYGGSRVPELFRPDVRVLATRGLRPTPSQPDFSQRIPESLASIKDAHGGKNPAGRLFGSKGVTDGELDIIPAAQKAIDGHQAALEQYLARAKGVTVSGDEVVASIRAAIPELLKTEDPVHAKALVDSAMRAFGGKMFPVETFRDFLRTGNASRFYSQSPGIQQGAANAGTPPAIESARTDAIRRVLYQALDPENAGAGPREIQSRTGALYDVLRAAQRRNNSIVAEQPITRAGELADFLKSGIRDIWPWKPGGTGISYAEGSEGRSLPYLRRAFRNVDAPPPLPRPQGLYPTGNPQRQLPAPNQPGGTMITPPPQDPSGIRSFPAMFPTGPNPARALPSPSAIITPPPQDQSFVRPAPAMPQPPNPRRALPAPGPPPQDFLDSEIGSQFGDRLLDPSAWRGRRPPQ